MNASTACPLLWRGFSIDCRGDVFSCCHMQPGKFGSIYDAPLREMVNAPSLMAFREKSIEGRLDCHRGCNLVRYGDESFVPVSSRSSYDSLAYLHLNFGEKCNIACIMCKVHSRRLENDATLNPDILIKNVDLAPFSEIVVQGGEPLYIRECTKYLEYLGQVGKKYILLTNGLLMDDGVACRLARDAAKVSISVNAATAETHEKVNRGSNFEEVKENIGRLTKAREILGSRLTICGRMTLTIYALHEIPLFIRSFKELGFDEINFGYDRATVPSFLAASGHFAEKLRSEIQDSLSLVDRSRVDLLRLEQLNLVPRPELREGG